jgi:hypothetical protein
MDEAAVLVDTPVIQGRYVELDDYTVSFETFPQDGHVPMVAAGTETVEFSPTKQLRQTMGVLASNLAAGGAL